MPPVRILLIVDDDLLCREVFTALAQEAGFQAHAFAAGDNFFAAISA